MRCRLWRMKEEQSDIFIIKNAGYKVKMYDYPKMQMAGGKRSLREFDIEELLFRAPRKLTNEKTKKIIIIIKSFSLPEEADRSVRNCADRSLKWDRRN